MTSDEDFVLDRAGPLVVGGGCSGHAFKFGPLLGEFLADLALGRTSRCHGSGSRCAARRWPHPDPGGCGALAAAPARLTGQAAQALVKTSEPNDLTCGIAASPRWDRPKMSSMVRSIE